MNNELQLVFKESDITYTKDKIFINNFSELKAQIEEISSFIRSSEVSENTVKYVKKILANANKTIDAMDLIKKQIKKDIMGPYLFFEDQVKELLGEIRNAERDTRVKVRQLEEKERAEKEERIKKLFEKRNASIYQIPWLSVEKFLKNEYLNKTSSIKKIEEEMVVFFERVKNDLLAIEKMENNQLLLAKYQENMDLAAVLQESYTLKQKEATGALKLPCRVSIVITDEIVLKTVLNALETYSLAFEIEEIN